MNKKYDVCAIGNALVDYEIEVNDAFFSDNNVEKGLMTLVDEEKQNELVKQKRKQKREDFKKLSKLEQEEIKTILNEKSEFPYIGKLLKNKNLSAQFKKDFDFQTANDKSRIKIHVRYSTAITGNLQASQKNCEHLAYIFKHYILSSLEER